MANPESSQNGKVAQWINHLVEAMFLGVSYACFIPCNILRLIMVTFNRKVHQNILFYKRASSIFSGFIQNPNGIKVNNRNEQFLMVAMKGLKLQVKI